MNKIVKEHYPAAKLPVELREGIDPAGHVTVTVVEEEKPPEHVMTLEEIIASRRPPYLSAKEIDEMIDELRGDRDA
ncbi:MAG: hypothetical protein H7X78_09340 [Methyloceanibacter sp.]|jgi:hypothetical protein|nr:hypothetical protein [Methyloceanibacter sp.]